MTGYMADWVFEKGSDGTDVSSSFTYSTTTKKYGSQSLKYNNATPEVDVMTRTDITGDNGRISVWIYNPTVSSGYVLVGPCGLLEWDTSNYEDAVAICLYHTTTNTYLQLGRLNAAGDAFTSTRQVDIASVISDDTWYLLELEFHIDDNNRIYADGNLYDTDGTTLLANLSNTYTDGATVGDQFGALFLRNSTDIYIDHLKIFHDY